MKCYTLVGLLLVAGRRQVSGEIPGPQIDDYPYKGESSGTDPWNFVKGTDTSFVAYRINTRLNIKFTNRYKGQSWNNANTWGAAARSSGVQIDSNAVAGSVAQTNSGRYGHVAWVFKVSGSQVTIEEYDRNKYSVRSVPKSMFNYIHF